MSSIYEKLIESLGYEQSAAYRTECNKESGFAKDGTKKKPSASSEHLELPAGWHRQQLEQQCVCLLPTLLHSRNRQKDKSRKGVFINLDCGS